MIGAAQPRLTDLLPLAPLQEGILYHATYAGAGADVYTAQLTLELTGRLDPAALRRAAQDLLTRHPHLGAAFRQRLTGPPVQVIAGRRRGAVAGGRPVGAARAGGGGRGRPDRGHRTGGGGSTWPGRRCCGSA